MTYKVFGGTLSLTQSINQSNAVAHSDFVLGRRVKLSYLLKTDSH